VHPTNYLFRSLSYNDDNDDCAALISDQSLVPDIRLLRACGSINLHINHITTAAAAVLCSDLLSKVQS